MKVEIMGKKNYTLNQNIEEVVEKKVEKLSKYFDENTTMKVLLKKEGDKCCMEISINAGGTDLRAQAIAGNMYDAVDDVVPKIERQIRKYKTRWEKKFKIQPIEDVVEEIPFSTSVVKEKVFHLSPMKTDEAIYQLDMLNHNFYMYLSEDTGKIEVVYLRNDGDYGVIKGEI